METDLDHFPVPLTKTSDNFHNMSLISPGSPKSFIEQEKVSSSPKPFTEQTKALTSLVNVFACSVNGFGLVNVFACSVNGFGLVNVFACSVNGFGLVDNTASKEYSPYVNLDDAVKWPAAVPGTLDFSHMEVFEGMNYLF
jgi:hypothetical protein